MNASPRSGSTNENEATMVKRPSINRRHAFPAGGAPASPVIIGQALSGGGSNAFEFRGVAPLGGGVGRGAVGGGGMPPQESAWTASFGFGGQQGMQQQGRFDGIGGDSNR